MLRGNVRLGRVASQRWCSASATDLQQVTRKLEQQIKNAVESKLKPLDYFGLSKAISDRPPYPMVLLVGNHSSGKSTWINDFIGEKVQTTGVAPIDDGFTLITRGDRDSDEDGPTLVGTPSHGFQDLASFGPTFISHLKLKVRKMERSSNLPPNMILIDSPGMIGSPSGDSTNSDRGYDLRKAMRWFAERADLIMVLFDPHNPGTTGETLDVLTEALSDLGHKSLILMNKVDQFDNATDFARAYGALCWHLSKVIPRKDIPRIYTTFTQLDEARTLTAEKSGLPVEEFNRTREEIRNRVKRAPNSKIDNILTSFSDAVWRVRESAAVCEELRKDYVSLKSKLMTGIAVIATLGVGSSCAAYAMTLNIPVLVLGSTASIGLAAALQSFARAHLSKYQKNLIDGMDSRISRINTSPENVKIWPLFKATLVRKLQQQELSELPKLRTGLFGSSLHDLDELIKKGIPEMRDEAFKARYSSNSA